MTTLLTNRCPLGCSIELAGSAGSLAVRCGVQVIFTGWAHMQSPGGMIQEVLGSMGGGGRITGPMDESAGGRTMSDTTTIFILDTFQVYLNTGDLAFVKGTWPHLVQAAQWQVQRTKDGNGFPHHLQNTCEYWLPPSLN
jgi:hypothetical protein